MLAALAVVACNDAAGPGDGECRGAEDLETCLPSWQEYSPLQTEQAPTADSAVAMSEVTETLERYDSTGATVSLGNVTFACTDSTYNFLDNPDRAISFNLDETVLWPGALIQGRSHRDGASAGGLLELPIRERAPLSVSITFNNQDNTRVVDRPDFGSVNTARGSMIGNAEAEGLATATNIEFSSETYSSERQAALSFGVSGRYLGFEASASGSVQRSVTTNVVAAQFIQQMYVVGVTQPATPADFFSETFTPERYEAQSGLGRIGPANPPLYVSRIGYGRMMVFAMSAKAEASEMNATLRTAWQGIGAGASATLSAKQQAILQESQIRITQVGGDQQNALNAIRSGTLADYFTDTAPLTSAAPLWFELKALTGEVAQVSEPGEYTVTTCTPRLPGTFEYQPEQVLSIPFMAAQRQVVPADVNGDGRMDLVYNERQSGPSVNRVHVAIAGTDGSYTLASPATHDSAPSQGWENFTLLVADVDGDGRDDLVWNHIGTDNVVYTGMSHGDGSFTWRPGQVHANSGWGAYTVTTGDLNGDNRTDLLWNNRAGATAMRMYFGLARDDSTFAMHANFVDRNGDYRAYQPPRIGRFDLDPNGDIVMNALGEAFNNTYVALFTPTSDSTGTLSWTAPLLRPENVWQTYQWQIGDVDGTNGADLIWASAAAANGDVRIYRSLNGGSGTFTSPTDPVHQTVTLGGDGSLAYAGDFNNDGRTDLLLNRRTSDVNELMVGFGTASGAFTFPAGLQTHQATPTAGWATYDQVFVADVNDDGKADIIWTTPAGDARVYVALAK